MSAFTSFLSGLTRRWPAIVLGCASVGALGGWIGGMISFSRQKLIFESHAYLYPASGVTGANAVAWMKTEAAAMRQRTLLEEAAEEAGLVKSWHRTPAECADVLEDAVRVTVTTMDDKNTIVDRPDAEDPYVDANGFSVLRVEMQGEKSTECAAVVNAIVDLRRHAWMAVELQRMDEQPDHIKYQAKTKEAREWSNRQAVLRKKLVAALPATGITARTEPSVTKLKSQKLGSLLISVASPSAAGNTETEPEPEPEIISASELASLQLSGPLKDLRDEWRKAGEESERATLEAGKPNMYIAPYANELQRALASTTPISPQWSTWGWPWTSGGLAAGLIAGLVFYRMKAWKSVDDSTPVLSPATAVEF